MSSVSGPTMVITHEEGLKFAAQVRSHRVLTDQAVGVGGEDAAPTPIELLGAALGSCVALYVQQFCLGRGLPYDGMRVEVTQRGAQNPGRIGEFIVRVVMPTELPEPYAALLGRVARSCPAHNTLHQGATVTVEIETPATVSV